MLLREVFEVLPEPARRPQAFRNQAGRFVKRVEPDDAGFTKLFGAVERPGALSRSRNCFSFSLRRDGVRKFSLWSAIFEPEEIEDCFDEAATLRG